MKELTHNRKDRTMKETTGYKLFRQRKNGTLAPLFINRKLTVEQGKWLKAEDHPTKGFAHRPGWHATTKPEAPHLSEKGRIWCKVLLRGVKKYARPESQGGSWLLARQLKVLEVL